MEKWQHKGTHNQQEFYYKEIKTDPEDSETCPSEGYTIYNSYTFIELVPCSVKIERDLSLERLVDRTAYLQRKENNHPVNPTLEFKHNQGTKETYKAEVKDEPDECFDDFLLDFMKHGSTGEAQSSNTLSEVLILSDCEEVRGKRVCQTLTYKSTKIPNGGTTKSPLYISKTCARRNAVIGLNEIKSQQTAKKGVEPEHFCQFCGRGYVHKHHLKVHMKTHTGGKQFYCQECGASFYFKDRLKSHQRVHSGTRPYTCGECGKSFTRSGNLREHQRHHLGERLHQCDCGKKFITGRDLKRHQMIHTGVKPFTCSVCGNSFLRPATLTKHMRIHTGERPYVCSHCGKTFPYAHSYNSHMNTHKV